jgi:transcriptional regulator with GAF, ATPase, and Fis domain
LLPTPRGTCSLNRFDENTLAEFGEATLESEGGDERRVPTLRMVYDGASRRVVSELRRFSRTLLIGRGVQGDDVLLLPEDGKVSRRHASLSLEPGASAIRLYNESASGTRVNGLRVQDEVRLVDNDVLRVGDTLFVFRWLPERMSDAEVPGLFGAAPAIASLRAALKLIAPSGSMVLLLGETGVGKEVLARGLHALSNRPGDFVAVNCGAIPETLAESQLFGHKAGAFTGASEDHPGYFRMAKGGTLFLDEVGELSGALQPKLLRVLDTREVFPVGATSPVQVDVRVIAATNRDLLEEVKVGAFRPDLYARLAEITLLIPPLKERREDVLVLMTRHLDKGAPPMKPPLAEALLLHGWPFNVREAVKVARELSVRGAGAEALGLSLLRGRIAAPREGVAGGPSLSDEVSVPLPFALPLDKPVPTREELTALLGEHGGIISRVAKATRRSRTQVYRWLEQYGLDPASYR